MKSLLATYSVAVVRLAGASPYTGQYLPYAEQEFDVEATSRQAAYDISNIICTLKFYGQVRLTYIDGEQYRAPH